MIRKKIFFVAVFLFAIPYAHADEASKRAKIEEMFVVLHMDTTMKQMMEMGMAQGKQAAKQMMGDTPMTPADQKIMDDYIAQMSAIVSDVLSWDNLKPAYVDLYASTYTEEQVDGILTFYKSPVGQVLLSKTPELLTKSSTIVNSRAKDLGPRLQELMAEMQKQLQAAHPDKSPAK